MQKTKAKLKCQFCHKLRTAQGIRTHERWCSENPNNEGSPKEPINEPAESSYEELPLEQLFLEEKRLQGELIDVREALVNRMKEYNLQFSAPRTEEDPQK